MPLRIEHLPSRTAAAARAADHVQDLLYENPRAVLLLPAGRTPVPVYRELVRRVNDGRLDLSRAQLFQLDEMIGVACDDERSFHRFLFRYLLEPIARGPQGVHLLDGRAANPHAEIEAHSERLRAAGGADLALLGIGRNGHVAFNEPGSGRSEKGRVVELADATVGSLREIFGDDGPRRGMTLGLDEIGASRKVVLLATGEKKSQVVATLVREARSSDVPASLLVDHAGFHLIVDEAAGALVKDR